MRVLFYDLSKRSTGWAVDSPTDPGRPAVGTYKGAAKSIEEHVGVRLLGFVSEQIRFFEPDLVGIEAPVLASRKDAKGQSQMTMNAAVAYQLIGLAYLVGTIARANGLPFEKVHVASARKTFLGSGRARKEAVVERCNLLGWTVTNTDEADAAAGWYHLKSNHDPAFRPETGQPLFASGGSRR